MAISGTEGKIIDVIARLGVATREQISKAIGFSLDYIEYLLNYLVKKGYLIFGGGRYSLPGRRRKESLQEKPVKKEERPAKKKVGSRKKIKSLRKKKKRQLATESYLWWEKEKKKKQVTVDKTRLKGNYSGPHPNYVKT